LKSLKDSSSDERPRGTRRWRDLHI